MQPSIGGSQQRKDYMMKRQFVCALALILAAPLALSAEEVDLEQLQSALEKYQDVNAALAAGYIPDPSGKCVSAGAEGLPAELGAMGIHYLNPELLKITGTDPRVNGMGTHTDWSRPGVLIYEPQADGTLTLVGVENLVFQEAWKAAGKEGPPEINGRSWDRMADDPATEADEAHGFAPHFDQHIWLFREPAAGGELEPFNANVTCDHQAQMKG